jgi:hypothetical protein
MPRLFAFSIVPSSSAPNLPDIFTLRAPPRVFAARLLCCSFAEDAQQARQRKEVLRQTRRVAQKHAPPDYR